MPQEFVVLRCKECRMFQKHLSGKTNKFTCKICYEKQSIIRCYSNGTGLECKRTVQRLNSTCAEADSDEVEEELERYSDELHRDALRRNGYTTDRDHEQEIEVVRQEDNSNIYYSSDSFEGRINGRHEKNGNGASDEGFEESHNNYNGSKFKSIGDGGDSPNDADAANSNGSDHHCNGLSNDPSAEIIHEVEVDVSKFCDQSPKAKRTKYSIF